MLKPKINQICWFSKYHIALRLAVHYVGKYSVYLLKIQITDIFDFCLLRQDQDLMQNCENVFGAQLSSRSFLDENATLLWKNGYKSMSRKLAPPFCLFQKTKVVLNCARFVLNCAVNDFWKKWKLGLNCTRFVLNCAANDFWKKSKLGLKFWKNDFFYQHRHFVFLKKQKLCWVVLGLCWIVP